MDPPVNVTVWYDHASVETGLTEGKLDVKAVCHYFNLNPNTIKIDGCLESVNRKGLMRRPILAGSNVVVTGEAALPAVNVVKRAEFSGRYVGHDEAATPVTVLAPGWLVTHAHGEHKLWTVGDVVPVWLDDEGSDQRRKTVATVRFKSPEAAAGLSQDYMLLHVEDKMQTPVLDTAVNGFEPYVLVGASARSQGKDPVSTCHGYVLSTRLDSGSHLLGDTPPQEGDSGGGCFLTSNGALFAICVGRREADGVLLPVSIPYAKAMELEGAVQQPQLI